MNNKPIRHVLGISGGKDSAALAVYMKQRHPELDIEYYFCDTGKELDETYAVIERLEGYLGQKIRRLQGAEKSSDEPFDHFLRMYGGYLPSVQSRWCTNKLKLEPFERYVGTDLVISYVGIRGDENRDAYISTKPNIQSIFPFRKNIWSEDVIAKVLTNEQRDRVAALYNEAFRFDDTHSEAILACVEQPLSVRYNRSRKLDDLLNLSTPLFNRVVHGFLRDTTYPLAYVEEFPLVDNADVLVRDDIFRILRDSGVGVPEYYELIEFEVDGEKGYYSRSRSGCFFCFFQQRIEWVWLCEHHPDLFAKAMEYEKEGYTWIQGERLEDLAKPERTRAIKREFLKRQAHHQKKQKSEYLVDILTESEGVGCAACFI